MGKSKFWRDDESMPGTQQTRELVTRLPGTNYIVSQEDGDTVIYRLKPASLDPGQVTGDADPHSNPRVVRVNAINRKHYGVGR